MKSRNRVQCEENKNEKKEMCREVDGRHENEEGGCISKLIWSAQTASANEL